jgi:hypothetical protein
MRILVPALAALCLALCACKTRPSADAALRSTPAGNSTLTPLWTVDDPAVDSPESVFHAGNGVLFVSSMAGSPGAKDGKGWIARLAVDLNTGRVRDKAKRWCCSAAMNAPKGLRTAMLNGRNTLWVTDMDRVLGIDVADPRRVKELAVPGAISLNDTATDAQGRVYVSDIAAGIISVIDPASGSVTALTKAVASPNGLIVKDGMLWALQWGEGETDTTDFSTSLPGTLWSIELLEGDGGVTAGEVKRHDPTGTNGMSFPAKRNFDGLELLPRGGALVTNFTGNALERLAALDPDGGTVDVTAQGALPGGGGAGDLSFVTLNNGKILVLVPRSFGGTRPGLLEAYLWGD